MNRRKFLISTGAAGSLLLLPSCKQFSGSASNRMNLATIGCGRRAQSLIRSFLSVAPEFNSQFVAVCDLDSKRVRKTATMIEEHYAQEGRTEKIRTYATASDLLADKEVDIVVIAVPDHSHAAMAIAAAKSKKAMYLEKPMTYTLEEGRQLVKTVRGNKLIFQVGSQQRSDFYFRRVCEITRNQVIGELKHIDVYLPIDFGYGNPGPMPVPDNLDYTSWLGNAPFKPYTEQRVHPQEDYSRPGWMQVEDYNHGMIANWGAHMLDIVQWGGGTENTGPKHIQAIATYEDRGLWDVHTQIEGECVYPNGVSMRLHALPEGDRGNAGVQFNGSKAWVRTYRGSFDASDRELLRWEPGVNDINLIASTNHYRNFLESVRKGVDPCAPVDVGHRSNSMCILFAIAARLKRELEWDPDTERFVGDDLANRMLSDMRLKA